MKAVTVKQMQMLDARTIDEHGTPGTTLMYRAGAGVAQVVLELLAQRGGAERDILMVAGKGNNGGDVFAAACELKSAGYEPFVLLAGEEDDITGDAREHLEWMQEAGIGLEEMGAAEDWEDILSNFSPGALVVEGLLGTGTQGAPREPIASAIKAVNALGAGAPIISIDIPSGMNGDTGETPGAVVKADVTATMALPKRGLLQPEALAFVGRLEVVDIGIPAAFIEDLPDDAGPACISAADAACVLPRRSAVAHKGTFGHTLLIAGARRYSGAAVMAARAAVRSGTGLVTVLTPESVAPLVASGCPEAMVIPGRETSGGSLAVEAWQQCADGLDTYSAVACGPGLTTEGDSRAIVEALLAACDQPLLLDADALNVLAGNLVPLKNASAPVVITPHPGELARLLGVSARDIQNDRITAAAEAAEQLGCVVVLKGAGTLVATPSGRLHVNLQGNPGMATGGSGDVLTGLLGGFLGQGLSAEDAARAAVYVHGLAGDIAAWASSQQGMIASDIVDCLPDAFLKILAR